MSRKQIGGVMVMVLLVTVTGLLIIPALIIASPLWLINPSIFNGASDIVMERITTEITRMMFRNAGRIKVIK